MSSEPTAHFRWLIDEDVSVAEVVSVELNQPRFADELSGQLESLLEPGSPDRVLIDFRSTKYMSSTAFGVLVEFVKLARERGVQVAICGMTGALRVGADILSLGRMIPMYPDQASALAYLRPGGKIV